jgi:hypothetical protein
MKTAVRNYFDRYGLSQGRLRRLRDIQNRYSPESPAAPVPGRGRYALPVAVLTIMVIAVFAWRLLPDPDDNIAALAAEIALHHNQRLNPEVESASLDEVGAYLEKLGFPLIESRRFPAGQWELAGGRYCSLMGQPAAQLRMRDKITGKPLTFYQLPVPRSVAGFEGSYTGFQQGVAVEIWKERGLLLAVARDDR